MSFFKPLFFIIVLIFIIILYWIQSNNGIYVKSNIDEHFYYVADVEDKQDVADILATIKKRIIILINYIDEENKINKQYHNEYYKYVKRLKDKLNEITFTENIDEFNATSYSVNKGDKLVVCLRSRETNKIHDINTIMYVILHEISHVMCPEYGHGELFQKIFKYVAQQAVNVGVYEYVDYSKNPTEYCGLTLTSTIL